MNWQKNKFKFLGNHIDIIITHFTTIFNQKKKKKERKRRGVTKTYLIILIEIQIYKDAIRAS